MKNSTKITLFFLIGMPLQTLTMEKKAAGKNSQDIADNLTNAFLAHLVVSNNPTGITDIDQAEQTKIEVNNLLAQAFAKKYSKKK